MQHVSKRVVLHFPGFEPLDAKAHHRRYERSARQSGQAWNCTYQVGPLEGPSVTPFFDVRSTGPGWSAETRIHVLDHNDIVMEFSNKPLLKRLREGFAAAVRVIGYGGMTGYFRNAWRFGLFFLFPFLLMLAGTAAAVGIVSAPVWRGLSVWHLLWSVPLAVLLFLKAFLPFAERYFTLHLFADWEMAVAMARLDNAVVSRRIEECVAAARKALAEGADEYLITSHSMGANMAVHVIGSLLEREPELFEGKRIVFATLGGAVLQCSLLKPASVLRDRVGRIARHPSIAWIDVQCLTDAIHFYRSKVVAASGHPDAPQASILLIRFKNMLTADHYRRIKRDMLRVHRQYVLGPDNRAAFDFTLMTAGPLAAASFASVSQGALPEMADDGALAA